MFIFTPEEKTLVEEIPKISKIFRFQYKSGTLLYT